MNYCSKCDINWARLWSEDLEGDEQIEFCPLCRNDEHLQPGKDSASFICCPFTGKITDVETGKELDLPLAFPDPPKYQAKPAMTVTEADYERKNDRALEAYFETGNRQDYFNEFKK